MADFIMLVGLPASGKSTYAEKMKNGGFRVHSSDKIREELTGNDNLQDKNKDVFTILHRRIKNDLRNGISCIYDATNMSMKRRKAFLNELKKIDCHKICILFAIPIEICKERNQKRDRNVPDDVFDHMLKNFWVPMYYEGWDQIAIISLKDYQFTNPIEKTYGFNQYNKHHTLDLWEHMFQAALYIHNHTECRGSNRYYNLCWAAHNHDIGKLYTQSFVDAKGNTSEDAHYYGHECYGAYVFLLEEIYNSNTDIGDIVCMTALINWHMRPHTAWAQSTKSRERDRKLLGEEMYQDIMLLHEADLSAH